ncbi:MAG: translation initiation factor IF-3 [Pseudomonadota bacterium]|nr:translation initiation factor IF-3 [Pseudomonadota bacterium]
MSKSKKMRINESITCSQVRLVDEKATQHGLVSIEEALQVAKDAGLDLVEVSPNSNPPVCRVMDYGKLVYHKKKQVNSGKKTKVTLKEIKFRPNTDVGDFNIKLKKISSFIEVGHRVKVTVIFRGREMQHRDLGGVILDRVEQALHELADIEQPASQEGKQLYMVVSPRKS